MLIRPMRYFDKIDITGRAKKANLMERLALKFWILKTFKKLTDSNIRAVSRKYPFFDLAILSPYETSDFKSQV